MPAWDILAGGCSLLGKENSCLRWRGRQKSQRGVHSIAHDDVSLLTSTLVVVREIENKTKLCARSNWSTKKPSKDATSCTRRCSKLISFYLELFLLPAKSYINFINADCASVGSQDLNMIVLSKSNLCQQTFSLAMASLVLATKNKTKKQENRILINRDRAETAIKLLTKPLVQTATNTH